MLVTLLSDRINTKDLKVKFCNISSKTCFLYIHQVVFYYGKGQSGNVSLLATSLILVGRWLTLYFKIGARLFWLHKTDLR